MTNTLVTLTKALENRLVKIEVVILLIKYKGLSEMASFVIRLARA